MQYTVPAVFYTSYAVLRGTRTGDVSTRNNRCVAAMLINAFRKLLCTVHTPTANKKLFSGFEKSLYTRLSRLRTRDAPWTPLKKCDASAQKLTRHRTEAPSRIRASRYPIRNRTRAGASSSSESNARDANSNRTTRQCHHNSSASWSLMRCRKDLCAIRSLESSSRKRASKRTRCFGSCSAD